MLELKPISKDAIPRALARAERYRLLNEPQEAESICRDVLRADPENQEALIMLLLCLSDQFGTVRTVTINEARAALRQVTAEYQRLYYGGIITERWAKAQHRAGALGHVVHDWLREAMGLYEDATAQRPQGNEEAILRWNACVRFLEREVGIQPRLDEVVEFDTGDAAPLK